MYICVHEPFDGTVARGPNFLSQSSPRGSSPITLVGDKWLPNGLICTIPDIDVSSPAVNLISSHTAINQPKGVDVTGDVPENGETNVDQKVTTAASHEKGCGGRKDDSDNDEADV